MSAVSGEKINPAAESAHSDDGTVVAGIKRDALSRL